MPVKDTVEKCREMGYDGNPLIKKARVKLSYTKEQIEEYLKCKNDPVYFMSNYLQVIDTDHGMVPFKLRDYQKKLVSHVDEHRFNIILCPRQVGKSTTVGGYLLWFVCFNAEKDCFLLANKAAAARETLDRIKNMLEAVPYFLQPGVEEFNKGSVKFENKSRIVAAATSSSSIRGNSASLLVCDEFSHVKRADEFYTSTYPVITSGQKSKVIIISTANGIGNLFHRIYQGAVNGTNDYKHFTVNWWDVPGRDEKWKEQQIRNTSELQFRQEHGNNFVGSGDTLLNVDTLLGLKAESPLIEHNNVKVYEKPIEGHEYILAADVAKGLGQDYSTFSILDISQQPYKQVCTYRNNTISPLLFPSVIYKYGTLYNNAYVLIENNDHGIVVANALYYDLEYDNFFTFGKQIGVTMNKKVKRVGCSNLKDMMEENKLHVVDSDTIIELSAFESNGSSFAATEGNHDDMVMNLVMFAWFASTNIFEEFSRVEFRDMIYKEKIKQMEDDLAPVGFFSDGSESDNPFVDPDGTVWKL